MDEKSLDSSFRKMYRKAMVTGGAGFIGSHLCDRLVKMGIDTISIDSYIAGKKENLSHLKNFKNFKEVKCDIRDKKNLPSLLKGVDIIFNQAASKKTVCLKDPKLDLEINAGGILNLLLLSKSRGVKKFVHASTGSVYGEAQFTPQDEHHPVNPTSYYGVSKLAGEKYVALFQKLFKMNTSILRYFHIYGPRQEFNEFGGVVSIFIRNLMNNETPVIFGDGAQERSFTSVFDAVNANLLVAVQPSTNGEIYNCASGLKITINDLCNMVIKAFKKDGVIKPKYEDWLVGDIKKFDINNKKITKLGLKFTTNFEQGLLETIKEQKKYIENNA